MPIIIERNGKRTVVTGWQAWLAGAVIFLVLLIPLALIAFVLLGVAITVGAVLLMIIPTAIVLALVASMFAKRG